MGSWCTGRETSHKAPGSSCSIVRGSRWVTRVKRAHTRAWQFHRTERERRSGGPITKRHEHKGLWLVDFARDSSTRFTFGAGLDEAPIWSPDGGRIVFASSRN